MAQLLLPHRWRRQPQFAVEIDANHPLARNLVFAALPVGRVWVELLTRQSTPNIGGTGARRSLDGNCATAVSLVGGNATGGQFPYRTGLDLLDGASYTIFAEASLEVNATESTIVSSREATNGRGVRVTFDDVSSQTNSIRIGVDNNSLVDSLFDSLGANSESFTHRVMWSGDGANMRFYTKGSLNRTVANTQAITADAARRTTILGVLNSQNRGSATVVLAWRQTLGLGEYLALFDNPWQIFRPLKRRIYVHVAAAGGGAGKPDHYYRMLRG